MEQSYIDDILDSVQTPEEARKLCAEVDAILALGSFEIKKWTVVDSSKCNSLADQLHLSESESVLGLMYDKANDSFSFRIHLNFYKRRRGIRSGPDLQKDEIFDTTIVPALTKRNIMSNVHSIYDPTGYVVPFIVELKFALGKLWRYRTDDGTALRWDDPVPPDHDELWRSLLNLFYDIERLKVLRCLSPTQDQCTGKPILVAFSDSSMLAFGACLYAGN